MIVIYQIELHFRVTIKGSKISEDTQSERRLISPEFNLVNLVDKLKK